MLKFNLEILFLKSIEYVIRIYLLFFTVLFEIF